ncbi:peptidoglycan-binding domain-containing protein [Streptomyces sp. NPDC038707]|uniref:peptidoglycan-binding domain-containing protein n=1 Tax=unclassified Streptomyces TaxID=2593676 RepID=UPI0033FDC3B5
MTGERGTTCPECGTPRGPDHTPACDCTERAAEALREARTAEAAAAEDFDPLRIRPYVTATPSTTDRPPAHTDFAEPPLPPAPAPRPQPSAPEESDGGSGPRSRRTLLLAGAGIGVALLAATAFALVTYRTPTHDRAAQEIRQSIPAEPTRAPAPAPSPPPPAAPPAPPPSPTAPAPTATTTPPSPRPTPTPTPSRGTPSPTPSPTATSAPPPTPSPPLVLRRGDTGPEVTELQRRLRRLNLYGDRVDGTYSRPVEDAVRNYQLARGIEEDPLGEYGPATRKSLERETSDP